MDGFKKKSVGKKTGNPGHQFSTATHRGILQKSATLNRKFVKKPAAVALKTPSANITSAALRAAEAMKRRQAAAVVTDRRSIKLAINVRSDAALANPAITTTTQATPATSTTPAAPIIPDTPAALHPRVQRANARIAARKAAATPPRLLSAQELKDRAIRQALQKVATMSDDQQSATVAAQMTGTIEKKKHFWHKRKFAAAFTVAAISIAALGYLVYLNLPDLSVQVAAMQTGIGNAYPKYIPKDYRLNGLVTEADGRITIDFSGRDQTHFSLSVEKSSWDSHALLTNFVTPEWDDRYTLIKDRGLTIYVHNSNATWVNGGVRYLITDDFQHLTKQQLHDIAISL